MTDSVGHRPSERCPEIAACHFHGPPPLDFRARFLAGLDASQKSLAGDMLFDRRSAEFRRLCALPEYYVERCEVEILRDHGGAIADALGPLVQLIDMSRSFGPQVARLLGGLDRPWGYVPIDQDSDALLADARDVQARYPGLWVEAVCADIWSAFDLPPNAGGGRRVAYLPGNAIGNMDPGDALVRLSLWARELRHGALMLIGVDLHKSVLIVESAYDDPHGINAALMHDILLRANRELSATFDVRLFEHRVQFDAERGRVRSDLVSLANQVVRVGDRRIPFEEGEPIHVGDSWKYRVEDFQAIARGAGLQPVGLWLDSHEMFSLHLLQVS